VGVEAGLEDGVEAAQHGARVVQQTGCNHGVVKQLQTDREREFTNRGRMRIREGYQTTINMIRI
jgi:hypothetical protein